MPTYHVSLSLTPPPSCGDVELIDLLHQAINRAMCEAIEIPPTGMIVEGEAAAVDLLEIELRAALEARGGSLESMTARRI
jgi:hypothetical protein